MAQLEAAAAVDLLGFSAFMIIRLKSLSVIIVLLFLLCSTAASQSIVETLPGYPGPLPFKLETGYIGADEEDNEQLFYYFFESEGDPVKDPLVLWITGGPGCSGLCGLVDEIGPLNFDSEAVEGDLPSFVLNPYSWTKVANIIFLDSPVGTGFSYATTSGGCDTTDTKTAQRIYVFLQKWLLKHPSFIKNRLYITGDSYGAIWIPMVAWIISQVNEAGFRPHMALEGYSMGNPKTDSFIDGNSQLEFAHRLGLLSDEYYKMAQINCNGNYVNPNPTNALCLQALERHKECVRDLYPYQILLPNCKPASLRQEGSRFGQTILEDESMRIALPSKEEQLCLLVIYVSFVLCNCSLKFKKIAKILRLLYLQEKIHSLCKIWANDPTVQEALHVRKGADQQWERCAVEVIMNFEQDVQTVIGYHQLLSKKGYRALVYSGDHDMVVPYTGTIEWIRQLNLTVDDEWRPWFVENEVAGYTERHINKESGYSLTFATVKGAGHTAPEYKRKECLTMFNRFLSSNPL